LFVAEIIFPEGVAPGEGKSANFIEVARNGNGSPVLRGSSIAGALRHAYAMTVAHDEDAVERWFGTAADASGDINDSHVRIYDSILDPGKSFVGRRTHNAIDRHTGATRDKSLFSLESLPPKTQATIVLVVESEADNDETRRFLGQIAKILQSGFSLGGNCARGIGRVELAGKARFQEYDLTDISSHSKWLDDQRKFRSNGKFPVGMTELASGDPEETPQNTLKFSFLLGVPRGQDFVVGDGLAVDYKIEPQWTKSADGGPVWRIPGSTIRGVFRGWVSRLAAREGRKLRDSLERHAQNGPGRGDEHGWGFIDEKEERKKLKDCPANLDDPVMDLFGSLFAKARFHIGDGYAPKGNQDQPRIHVAVDRFSGGANEGALFDNTVLQGDNLEFRFHATIRNPKEREVEWIIRTLRAIDLGILRIGSSKGAGRLGLKKMPEAVGPHAELFRKLQKNEVSRA
jgi:CRISPR/Cas system CSM-associated protein Csm3 (group 7 of RAMP superfamily)